MDSWLWNGNLLQCSCRKSSISCSLFVLAGDSQTRSWLVRHPRNRRLRGKNDRVKFISVVTSSNDILNWLFRDLNKLQEGIGEKVGMSIFFFTIFFASLITAFIFGWELTLVILSVMPVMTVVGGIMAKAQGSLAEKEMESYGKAGVVAEEVFGAVRTVIGFGGQKKEIERYEGNLKFAQRSGIFRGMLTGVSTGMMWFLIFASYALAFWYGVKLIMDDVEDCKADPTDCHVRYDPKSLLVVSLNFNDIKLPFQQSRFPGLLFCAHGRIPNWTSQPLHRGISSGKIRCFYHL